MSDVAINETKSALIGELVSFWDYDRFGDMSKLYGEVHSSFRGEDRKDYGREVLHIKLIPESALKYFCDWADAYSDDVKVL